MLVLGQLLVRPSPVATLASAYYRTPPTLRSCTCSPRMPRSSSGAAGRGTKRQRTSGPAATRDDDDPEADLPTSPASPTSHIDPAIDSLLQHSAASIDPPSPPASSLSSHYFDAHIGSGKPGSRRRTQRSLLAVRQEALQAGLDASIPLLCQDANERSDRLLAEHRQLFPAWHMRLKSISNHSSTCVLASRVVTCM